MGILSVNEISRRLYDYYIKNYGFRSEEVWLESEAVNIRRFKRDGKLVILRCHIINGTVSEEVIDSPSLGIGKNVWNGETEPEAVYEYSER